MTIEATKSLDQFTAELAAAHLRGQWESEKYLEAAVDGPTPSGIPYVWRWQDMYPRLLEACDVLTESYTARRHLSGANPGLQRGTTHTMSAGFQIIRPGEMAWAHRHTINAIRFVVQGHPGLYSVVDGEPCVMEDSDLVLTPGWTWHDHHNPTDQFPIWLDALDVGLAMMLNQTFYEPFGEASQPVRERRGDFVQERLSWVRPTWEQPKSSLLPIRYPWREVEPRLHALAESNGSPYEGAVLEYVNPVTGGPALPTMACWIQLLRPGEETNRHRRTSSHIYYVVRGSGTTVVGDNELEWSERDLFVVPNWMWHHHRNRSRGEEAILFSVNDIPTLTALGFYREEPETSLHVAPTPAVPANVVRPATM